MDECFILEPLVIQGLSHSVNLAISFLIQHNLKINCTEEEVALMPVKDRSTSRARLVDGRYHSFISKKTGRVLKTTEDQMISLQVWRITQEKIIVITKIRGQKRPEEARRGHRCICNLKENCSIPTEMGKYIPVLTNREITGEVLIEISDKTIPGLVLPEIVYNIKKKLG